MRIHTEAVGVCRTKFYLDDGLLLYQRLLNDTKNDDDDNDDDDDDDSKQKDAGGVDLMRIKSSLYIRLWCEMYFTSTLSLR